MKLHLLRHAKTSQESDTGRDYDRALNAKGIAQCALVGDYLSSVHPSTEIWCSSARRTKETWKLTNERAKLQEAKMIDDLYLCSRATYLDLLWHHPGNADLLIVGHNYGISDLATYFVDQHIELRTGEYICIEFENLSWKETSRGIGIIVDRYRPEVDLL